MSNAIKEWDFDLWEKPATISLFEKEVKIVSAENNRTQDYDFEQFLLSTYVISSLEVDYQLLKEMTKLPKPKTLSAEASRFWDFWKYFNAKKVRRLKTAGTYSHEKIRTTAFGIEKCYKDVDGKWVVSATQRYDRFFFYGPSFPSLDIEFRSDLRKSILDAFAKKSPLTAKAAFILFDYQLEKKHYWEERSGISGEFVELSEGYILVGGWDNPKDGGAITYSWEHWWYFGEKYIQNTFKYIIPTIKKLMQPSILDNIAHEAPPSD